VSFTGLHEKVTLPIAGNSSPSEGVRSAKQLGGVWLGTIVGVSVAVAVGVSVAGCAVVGTAVKGILAGVCVVTSIAWVGTPGAQDVKRKATITISKMFVFIELLS
jgi:hypothetical protein